MLTKKERGKVSYLLELENLKALIPRTSTHPWSLRRKLRGIRKIPRCRESKSHPGAFRDRMCGFFIFLFETGSYCLALVDLETPVWGIKTKAFN